MADIQCRRLVAVATPVSSTYRVRGGHSLIGRGQDAAGIVTCGSGGRFYQVKANGMVRDVFDEQGIAGLKGWMGVGHGEWDTFPICGCGSGNSIPDIDTDAQSAIPLPEVQHTQKRSHSTSTRRTVSFSPMYVLPSITWLRLVLNRSLISEWQPRQYPCSAAIPGRRRPPTHQHRL